MKEIDKVIKFLRDTYQESDDNYFTKTTGDVTKSNETVRAIRISINNETIRIDGWVNTGKDNNGTLLFEELKNQHYSYLQTYEHLPRDFQDQWGYYQRSTAEEVIRYITNLHNEIWVDELREKKLNEILND